MANRDASAQNLLMMPNQSPPNEPQSESPDDIEAWARDVIAAVGGIEARRIVQNYEALAADPKVTKHGREIAAQRANALKRKS